MNRIIDYIDASCRNLKENQETYRYKRKVLEDMTKKAKELAETGLKDEQVITDLVTDVFGNLSENYTEFEKKKKRKKLLKFGLPIGSLAFVIILFAVYFIVSGTTGAWGKTWLIIVGGIFALVIFLFTILIAKLCTMRRVFHPIARILIVGCTILLAVFAFLFMLIMLPSELLVWPVLPSGVIIALIGDLIFAFTTKQKLRTISFFVYMPVISTMIYVILAAYGVFPWWAGWPVILLGLVVDLAYIIYIIMKNMKYFTYKQEVEE